MHPLLSATLVVVVTVVPVYHVPSSLQPGHGIHLWSDPPPCNLPPCNPPACKPPSCKPSPCKSPPCPAACPPPPLYNTSPCSTSSDSPIPTKNQPRVPDNRHWPKCVLGISKLSAFEFLKTTHPNLSNNQLFNRLRKRSIDPDEILAEHHRQLACEKELARILHNLDVSYRIMKRIDDASRCVDWVDLVIAIGGDGTFLLASKLITSNKIPIFGINPHPGTSNTFTLPIKYNADIERIFEKLRAENYTFLMRSRIRTIMTGEGLYGQPFHVHEKNRMQGEKRVDALMRSTQRKIADALQPRWRILPWLALNEVFMAEFLASRPIMLTIQADEEEKFMIRSSGICVCTGSGSRSWFRTMNLQTVETVQTLAAMATGRQLDEKETCEVLYKYHNNLLFPPENLKMAYMIYEMSRSSLWPQLISNRRMCRRIKVKSMGFDAGLVLDGSVSLPFNDGSTASFEIRPEYSLKNIVLQ